LTAWAAAHSGHGGLPDSYRENGRLFLYFDAVHVSGRVSPADDVEIVNTELLLADLETVSWALERASRAAKSDDRKTRARLAAVERVSAHLGAGLPARTLELPPAGSPLLRDMHLLTSKPLLYIDNVDEAGFADNPYVGIVKEIAAADGGSVVSVCAALEADLAGMDDEEKREFLADIGVAEPGLNRVIGAGYACSDC